MIIIYFLSFVTIFLAVISATYLQLPTFFLPLRYRWFHNYRAKRWFFRSISLLSYLIFILSSPPGRLLIIASIPFFVLWIWSLFNNNSNVFIDLNEDTIKKSKNDPYPADTRVVGYEDENGDSICYPIKEILMPRHLINDVFKEEPIFISFCAACRSTMIYDPVLEGERLTFEVVGVYRRNMVIQDKQTGTIWQQGTGEAVYGKLKGTRLKYLPYQIMTIAEWKKLHPDTLIAKETENVRYGVVPKKILMKLLKIPEKGLSPGRTEISRLPPREKVWGAEVNGHSKAYAVSELNKVNKFKDNIGETEVEIEYDKQSGKISGQVADSGEKLRFQNHWWMGWEEFHPDTKVLHHKK